jgi:hypothetical protein
MAPTEFHQALSGLNLAQQRVAQLFDVSPRAVRRWQHGERRVPRGLEILVRLMTDGVVTVEQLERAAVHRTNGGPEPAGVEDSPPLIDESLLVEPPSEAPTDLAEGLGGTIVPPNVAQCAESVTTAEKVAALTSRSCRWPHGDPASPEFRFCGEATTIPPYCEEHRGVAYMAPPTRSVRRDRASARSVSRRCLRRIRCR